jgi:hypothetical protein
MRDLLRLVLLVTALSLACGQKTVKLTIPQLKDLELCVINADDSVVRQNCVERLFPQGEPK